MNEMVGGRREADRPGWLGGSGGMPGVRVAYVDTQITSRTRQIDDEESIGEVGLM